MERVDIGVGMDGDRRDAQLAAGANDPDRNLTAVGDQEPLKGGIGLSVRKDSARYRGMLPCFLAGTAWRLCVEHRKRAGNPRPRFGREDHLIDVPARRGDVGVGESILVLGDKPRALGGSVIRRARSRRGR